VTVLAMIRRLFSQDLNHLRNVSSDAKFRTSFAHVESALKTDKQIDQKICSILKRTLLANEIMNGQTNDD